MPTLKQITCSIELGPRNARLKEYGAKYHDGAVETLIAVPNSDLPFSIHMASEGYIAPGLAMYVFIDGIYQCNRNKIVGDFGAGGDPSRYNVDIRVRQKEEQLPDGIFLGRDWTFANLHITQDVRSVDADFRRNVGNVEVVILRCVYDDNPIGPRSMHDAMSAVHAPSITAPLAKAALANTPSIKVASVKATSLRAALNAGSGGGGMLGRFFDTLDETRNYGLDGAEDWGAGGGHFHSPQQPLHCQHFAHSLHAGMLDYGQPQYTPMHDPRMHGYVQRHSTMQHRPAQYDHHQVAGGGAEQKFPPDVLLQAQRIQLYQRRHELESQGIDVQAIMDALPREEAMRKIDFSHLNSGEWGYLRNVSRRASMPERGREYETYGRRRPSQKRARFNQQNEFEHAHEHNEPDQDQQAKGFWEEVPGDKIIGGKAQNHKGLNGKQSTNGSQSSSSTAKHDFGSQQDDQNNNLNAESRWDNNWAKGDERYDQREDANRTQAPDADAWNATDANYQQNDGQWPQNENTGAQQQGNDGGGDDWGNENGDQDGGYNTGQNDGWNDRASDRPRSVQNDNWNNRNDNGRESKTMTKLHFTGSEKASWAAESNRSGAFIKPYWADWSKPQGVRERTDPKTTRQHKAREVYAFPAAAHPAITANDKVEADHGVKAGKGALYGHKTRRPTYVDSMQAPYAVFVFKYRSKEKLERLLGRDIDDDDVRQIAQQAEKDRFMSMPKEMLVERMMQMKVDLGKKADGRDEVHPEDSVSQTGGQSEMSRVWGAGNDNGQVNDNTWADTIEKKGSKKGKGNQKGRSKRGNAANGGSNGGFVPVGEGFTDNNVKW